MKIEIIAKNYQVSEKLNETIAKKVAKLDKYFDEETRCKVYLKVEKRTSKMEISLEYRGSFIRAEAKGENFYDNIDIVLPKLEKQIYKHRSKLESKLKSGAFKESKLFAEVEDNNFELVKTKHFELVPVDLEEAIDRFEMTGHSFYVFADKNDMKTKVLYLRDDGNIGLIDPVIK